MGARAETIAPTAEPAVQTSGSGTMVCTPSSSTLGFSLHKDRGWWHLCDSRTIGGKRRHKVLESYGRERPTLFAPIISSGVDRDAIPRLPSESFDLAYLDPPYGTTSGEWDRAPDWSWLGAQVARILKPTGQAVLHGTAPMIYMAAAAFSASGLEHRFDLQRIKTAANARLRSTAWVSDFQPIRAHEWILVFKRADSPTTDLTFNITAMHRQTGRRSKAPRKGAPSHQEAEGWSGDYKSKLRYGWGWPIDVIFKEPAHGVDLYAQKPDDLTAYLVMLLTNPGDSVLDPYAGSGTTVRVSWRLGRRATGIEAQPDRFVRLSSEFATSKGATA